MRIKIQVCKMVEQDNYEKGCIGKSSDFGIIDTHDVNTLNEAYIWCTSSFGSAAIFDNRFEIQRMENDDGYTPSSHEMTDFKDGKIDLWAATYSCYLSKVEETKITNLDLIAAFPELEQL